MPKGPQGQKRPADVIGNAIMIARIATGEVTEILPGNRRNSGFAGAAARAKNVTEEKRKQIAKSAADARWSNQNETGKSAL